MIVERSAGAIIFRKENDEILYLLLCREARVPERQKTKTQGGGVWDFPKGLIEKGEKTEEAVRREVEEETGIKNLELIDGFKETVRFWFVWEGEKRLKYVAYFLGETKTKDVKISFEHIGYIWLPSEEALERLTFRNSKDLLKKANNFLTKSIRKNNKHRNSTAFETAVYEVVRKIPAGKTMTYGQVARSVGRPKAARAVGNALKKNFNPSIPCHRVIKSNGKPGFYNRGAKKKAALLKKEA